MDETIKEGFLCPICLKDLKSPTHLASHFETFHSNDKDVLHQLRSVFGKAKRKLLKDEIVVEPQHENSIQVAVSRGTPETGGIDIALWETQMFGQTCSHLNLFRQRRKETMERCVVETNKLLIRLEKLIKSGVYASDSSLPNVLKTRKDVEKAVVPWEDDNSTKFCPICSKKFTLIYRRHHCRLCGKVICENCIGNLDMNLACDVIKLDQTLSPCYIKLDGNTAGDNGLKACDPCHILLIRQNKLTQDKKANNVLLQLYEKMQISMREADLIQPLFLKMANSVNAGETDYGLETVMEMRVKLLKSYETVEALSKRIQSLGLEKEKQPHPQILKLQRSVRAYASNYLVNNMLTMPGLPTKEQHSIMLQQRAKERGRLKATNAPTTSKSDTPPRNSPSPAPTTDYVDAGGQYKQTNFLDNTKAKFKSFGKDMRPVFQAVAISRKVETSWGPVQVSTSESSDPIVQQIENVKGYIRQAYKEQRYDEVEMFEQNLKELELTRERLKEES